ncbi:MAG: ComEC family competence protein [Alphaproteobacteria bacterium]|nr:ComEC family competence protein [Alphaproteobacteria bacterium]
MGDPSNEDWGEPRVRARSGILASGLAVCARALEAESDRWFLWLPVFFAGGIVAYFTLTNEPEPRIAIALLLAAVGVCLTLRNIPLGFVLGIAFLAFTAGFATAKLRTEMARAPVLDQELRYVPVSGWVEAHELRDKGRARILLRVISLADLSPGRLPYRVRVTLPAKNSHGLKTGEAVRLRATLQPPPEPVEPGAFDFARRAWFARLGGTGYATSRLEPLEGALSPPWSLRAWAMIDSLRAHVNARIRAALPGDSGAVAVALITGERGAIPPELTQAMRDSGLAHILAISGLHMVIMAGTVFWFVRALLALSPGLALRFPIKKWAAVIALAAATFYLALSGAAVPTIRAWIMMSIVLVAVMLDRPAITMRNVALAAIVILLVAPESLFDPSFDMSFAAVVALVALYEWLSARKGASLPDVSPLWRWLRKGSGLVFGAAATTLVAGMAVAPFAVYHFHRMTHFGLVANLLAVPLVSLLVMPMALLALIAMPFGLEAWPLKAMGAGIELIVAVGSWVASWPGAVSIVPQISGTALILMVLGGLWLCLWQTRARAFGLVIIALGLALAPPGNRPDVLIERQGETMALRSKSGHLAFPPATAASYSVDNWLLADGDDRNAEGAADDGAFRCDMLGCIGTVKGKRVALIRHPGALEEDCRRADIVVVPFTVSKTCRARVIVDRRMLRAHGAHALYIDGLSIRTETVSAARGQRPWVPERNMITPAPAISGTAFARGDEDSDERFDEDPEE